MNDFNVYQHLLLIFVAVSVIELIFVQQCFIRFRRFVQLVTLKVWWSIWRLLKMCHRLLTFEYKNRQFVLINSKVIPQLECGPMHNVMAALPNIGGVLCSTPQTLADTHCCSTLQYHCQDAKPVEISWGAPNYQTDLSH